MPGERVERRIHIRFVIECRRIAAQLFEPLCSLAIIGKEAVYVAT